MGQERGRVAGEGRGGGQGRRYTEKQTSEGKRHTRKDMSRQDRQQCGGIAKRGCVRRTRTPYTSLGPWSLSPTAQRLE